MQVSNDNFVYELQHARVRDFMNSPGMAEIYVKREKDEERSEAEAMRLLPDNMLDISGWEITFIRHAEGRYSEQMWREWDHHYRTFFIPRFPRSDREEVWSMFNPDFRAHVDAACVSQ